VVGDVPEPVGRDRGGDVPAGIGAEIRTFLIADVRGYTLFTQQRGDEAAAKLAAKFARVAREVVDARGGEVIELRGDEALAVFVSARQAVRAAVDLQERFVDETIADADLPMPVGIGLDAGEAVPVEGGYRGGALNLAARLCGQAGPGEVLASRGVTHLARKVEGVRYLDRGSLALKNLPEPVEVVRVLPEGDDPAIRLRSSLPQPAAPPRNRRRMASLVAVGVVLALLAVALPFALGGDEAAPAIRAGAVALLDPSSAQLRGQTAVGDQPRDVATGLGSLWVTDQQGDAVVRIDPASFQVQERIAVGASPTGVVVAAGFVWVANTDERTVSVVDPDVHRVVQTVVVGGGPAGLAAADGRIWVTNSVDASVSEIDPATGDVLGTYRVGERPSAVVADATGAWVANLRSNTVSRVVPGTGETQVVPVGRGPSALALDARSVWVANGEDGTISRIDADSLGVISTVPVGASPSALEIARGSVWVANTGDGTLSRIDAGTAAVEETIDVGSQPRALAADGRGLWVAAQAPPAVHRGGTLRVVSDIGAATLDPTVPDLVGSTAVLFTNDGLVTTRRAAGAAGRIVVPDLAVSMPTPTDQGRTYTFQLRDDVRFSDGRLLTPQDVVATFERALVAPDSYAPVLFPPILGAESCTPDAPDACDLSEGIVTGDRSVTFHLAEPSPDFLTILGTPFFSIVPADSPVQIGLDPVPATGPYMVTEVGKDGSLVLERNPEFREWSADAQPAGFVDRIEIVAGIDPDRQVDMVQAGEADVMLSFPPIERIDELLTRFADQVTTFRLERVVAVFLDTTSAPFDDVDARQAFALALDRQTLADLDAELALLAPGPPTCQLVPPDLPGYAPFCPFTRGGDDGTGVWQGPDLAEARRLVERSGTVGEKVELRLPAYLADQADVIAAALEDVGYRVDIEIPDIDRFTYYGDIFGGDVPNVGILGWGSDYSSPAQFLAPLLACRSPEGRPEVTGTGELSLNLSGFCDPAIDRRMGHALDLRATDPYASVEAFRALDRELTELAPIVPFSNGTGIVFVSSRVGNVQVNPKAGALLSQMWVR
jgi:peptide/nickel transport system substrate-binding protein